METIDEILREMINLAYIDKESDEKIPRKHMASALSGYAHRIDVAVKALVADRDNWRRQELEEDEKANLIQSVTNCNQFKMREVLEEFVGYSELVQRMGIFVRDSLVKITTKAREALAKPPRNCDLYKTEPEAYQAYRTAMKNKTKKTYVYFEPWLFAEAKGEQK